MCEGSQGVLGAVSSHPHPPQIRGSRGPVSAQGSHPSLICHQLVALPPPRQAVPILASDPWGGRGRVINLSHTDS